MQNKIYPILPRNEEYCLRVEYALSDKWSAFSLAEFKDLFCDDTLYEKYKEDEEFNISFYDEELDWLINGEYIVDGNFKTFKVKKAVEYDLYRDEINLIGDYAGITDIKAGKSSPLILNFITFFISNK